MELIRVGIFFGGPSREREISFAGGRTVYDNLNKNLFEPIPIFVDSNKRLIKLDWKYIYKGTIRDFYPPVTCLPQTEQEFQIYVESLNELSPEEYNKMISQIGTPLNYGDLVNEIDIAFLALHGVFGEDGQIQGLLESMGIPYTGSDVLSCAIGMNKGVQKSLMESAQFVTPDFQVIPKHQWTDENKATLFETAQKDIGLPFVIRPANQGSSIGVSIVKEADQTSFNELVDKAFFRKTLRYKDWVSLSADNQLKLVRDLSDLRDGLGFPMHHKGKSFYHPQNLFDYLTLTFEKSKEDIQLISEHSEQEVIVEAFIKGKEFSCIVLRLEDGTCVALPPTEILKGDEVYDYRSKYMPGLSRKVTPIDLANDSIIAIQKECERLFDYLKFKVYARIDGFIQDDGTIILNDPNTTSGMLPSSFFFHQAAEIGLNPSQFLSYIIRTSLQERSTGSLTINGLEPLIHRLDEGLKSLKDSGKHRYKTGVFLGGYSFERHISVESGRNIYEKLASSKEYEPVPIFLMKDGDSHKLFQIPISLLLKDNADDIRDKILHFSAHPITEATQSKCQSIIDKYIAEDSSFAPIELEYSILNDKIDLAFIALHGRPGEDGTVQAKLKEIGIPYNGSDTASSQITINKYETLQKLKAHGFEVTDQMLIHQADFNLNKEEVISSIENEISYPLIAKPVDDGCSSAVMKIDDREKLLLYLKGIFREAEELDIDLRKALQLGWKEEFPKKPVVLIEALIDKKDADHFMEITGGLLTHLKDGQRVYELFEPSEALATDAILSLEEKFLAGEGQNLTPARFGESQESYHTIAKEVKSTLQRAAEILDVKGYARIDAFVRIYKNGKVETIIIEINSLPGMTPATCIFHQCAINGYKPYDFIDKILEFARSEANVSL